MCLCEQSVVKQTRAFRRARNTVHFPLAPAWETNCYSKSPNRQLSVVSVHKKAPRPLREWKQGRKAPASAQKMAPPYPRFTESPHLKFPFIKPEDSECHVVPCGQARPKNGTSCRKYRTRVNPLCVVQFLHFFWRGGVETERRSLDSTSKGVL